MAKAIEQLASGLTVGYAALGTYGEGAGSVRQEVTDGDTVNVNAVGEFGVRLLGIDAPESSYVLPEGPEEGGFARISDPRWDRFLGDPFAGRLPPFEPVLEPGLVEHLQDRTGPGVADNHYRYASAAEDALEAEILADMQALGQTKEEFRFFLAFSYEIVEAFGRFLCFVNRRQPNPREPAPRPLSYNERLLLAGSTSPYFIWPNVNPYRRAGSIVEAVIRPGEAAKTAEEDDSLRGIRAGVKDARDRGAGIYAAEDPLRLLPFELRFLADRTPPERWVIDLSKNDDTLIPPQRYFAVPNAEDRLFVPEEYVPLFVEAGWKRG